MVADFFCRRMVAFGGFYMRCIFGFVLVFSSVAHADTGPFSVESAIYRVEVPSLDGRSMSQGTGVLIAQDKILTNCHVAKSGGAPGVIHRQTGKRFYTTGYYSLGNFDACVLRGGFVGTPAPMSSEAREGESVWVFGYPSAMPVVIQGTVKGIAEFQSGRSLVITAFCSPGSSGGPVVNARGQIVGLQWGMVQFQNNQCLAIPASFLIPYLV